MAVRKFPQRFPAGDVYGPYALKKGTLCRAYTAASLSGPVRYAASMGVRKNSVFISYSHKDQQFLDELLEHLVPLTRAGKIAAWSDRQIQPGAEWRAEIDIALASAKVVVLLVSPSFMASDFVHEHELGPALQAAETTTVRILWFMVRACSYTGSPIAKYQAIISPEKSLAEMKAERGRAYVTISEAILEAAQTTSAEQGSA